MTESLDAVIFEETKTQVKVKKKRDIFRFNGDKDISINLEHVTTARVEGNRITFEFYSTQTFVDLEDDDSAKKAYDQIVAVWSTDVAE